MAIKSLKQHTHTGWGDWQNSTMGPGFDPQSTHMLPSHQRPVKPKPLRCPFWAEVCSGPLRVSLNLVKTMSRPVFLYLCLNCGPADLFPSCLSDPRLPGLRP